MAVAEAHDEPLVTIPNALSGLRLVLAPVLLWLAWMGRPTAFLVTLSVSLLSDLSDGWFARRFDQATHLGTLLDSYGDLATYTTVPLCAWWLWPELIRREGWYAAAIVAAYLFSIGLGYLKYGRLTAYHTYGAKLSAVVVGANAMVLFAGGPARPSGSPPASSSWPSSRRSRSRPSSGSGARTCRRCCTRDGCSAVATPEGGASAPRRHRVGHPVRRPGRPLQRPFARPWLTGSDAFHAASDETR
jgi:phosphatidylglycerophosphate synthase